MNLETRPLIVYVDDEPHNLTTFEATFDGMFDVRAFSEPLKALEEVIKLDPCVIVSDQRMPGMTGVNLLELVKRTNPFAKRVLVTGYSDEDLVVESVRKAQIHDYIRKPWDTDDLQHRILKMIEAYQLECALRAKTQDLEMKNKELINIADELRNAKEREEDLRKELEAWAPPFILKAIRDQKTNFPMKKDLALITCDVVDSSNLHGIFLNERSVRSYIIRSFSEAVIRHGGWRESISGDSAYAHFGLVQNIEQPVQAAFAVANEFRLFLRTFSETNKINVECGIGLHVAKNCLVDLLSVKMETSFGLITQKSFDTTSTDIDLVHRIEKLTHLLPGSNIAMTNEFVKALNLHPTSLAEIQPILFKGQKKPTSVYIKTSDKVSETDIKNFQENILKMYPTHQVNEEINRRVG